jgi:hypothetical protein
MIITEGSYGISMGKETRMRTKTKIKIKIKNKREWMIGVMGEMIVAVAKEVTVIVETK